MIYHSPICDWLIECEDGAVTCLRPALECDHTDNKNDCMQATRWLDAYFSGAPLPELPQIKLRGTDYRLRVWEELLKIPFGAVMSYGQLARIIGSSPRAVGGAVGANPIAIIVPCHRIIAGNGIGGYAYGTDLKRQLLSLEGVSD